MSTVVSSPHARYPAFRDLTPAAQAATLWFRQLARALRTCRLYHRDNPIVVQVRADLYARLTQALSHYGAWSFRIKPTEIFLLDEPVVHPGGRSTQDDDPPAKEEQIPFLFHRDGIRGLMMLPDLPLHDFDALFDAMLISSGGLLTHDDLVTLLWQANPTKIQIDAVPVLQTIYLSSRAQGRASGSGSRNRQTFSWSPSGAEIRAELGQAAGVAQGLHRDTFDDWPLPESTVDVPQAYASLMRGIQFARTRLLTEWSAESAIEWTSEVPPLFRRMLALDPGPETRRILIDSNVTWLVSSIQRSSWEEARDALSLLRDLDPNDTESRETLSSAMAGLDSDTITERLDESEVDDQFKFFGLCVAIGRPALDLACAVMAKAARSRTRAAACTMLCYLCGEDPALLAPYLTDSRWYVVRNTVFVLGQIGGSEVVGLLRSASAHPDPRVRRQVVHSLGGVPPGERLPILLAQLGTRDPRLLAATLHVLVRHKDSNVARAIVRQIVAPDFEVRSEDVQRALFGALVELGSDDAVPPLEALLQKGGWFARRSWTRAAAARTLQRLGTPRALAALDSGLRSRSEAVRQACLDAVSVKAA